MSAIVQAQPSIPLLTKVLQVGCVIANPAALLALGGPVAIWNNHGYFIRAILCTHLAPTVILGAGAAEDAIRAIILISKDCIAYKSVAEIEANPLTQREVKRAGGLTRAALFPISGWAALVKLPVSDHYIYAVPKEITVRTTIKTGEVMLKVIKTADKIMTVTGMYKVMEVTLKLTVKPCYQITKAVAVPCYKVISGIVTTILVVLVATLGLLGRGLR